jgi:hypothetical protein
MDAATLATELERALGYPVRVEFTRARSSPIQLRHARTEELKEHPGLARGWVVRLHAVFAQAPPQVLADLASWIRVGGRARRASRELGAWTESALAALPPRPARRTRIETSGRVHDLAPLAAELLGEEFARDFDQESPAPPATWGRGRSRTRGRLQLGSFEPQARVVRIHAVLDQRAVPPWLVRYVLFHELLHAALPGERDAAGRLRQHGPQFRARERVYADYQRALLGERAHLGKLLRSARTGRPLRVLGELGL